jgi:hypothetical protein
MERLELKIHLVTPAKCKLFDELFELHERQLSQEIGTKATGPSSEFAKALTPNKAAAKDEAYEVANITPDQRL